MQYAAVFAVTVAANVISGIGGFGAGMFAMPFLLMMFPLQPAAVGYSTAVFVSAAYLAWRIRGRLHFKKLIYVGIGQVTGTPVGIYLLSLPLDVPAKMLLSAVIVSMASRELFASSGKDGQSRPTSISVPPLEGLAIGVLSGILGGWINMGGPPLILYAYNKLEGKAARAFLVGCFFLVGPFKIATYALYGMYTPAAAAVFGWALPGIMLGVVCGDYIQNRMDGRRFAKTAWSIMLALGIMLAADTLRLLASS